MVHAFHLILVTYGSWLPNDPRGSWTDFVASWELFRHGRAPKMEVHFSLLDDPKLGYRRAQIQQSLRHKPVAFDDNQILRLAKGFQLACEKSTIPIWAASILPEHCHFVVGRSRLSIERVASMLKSEATKQLSRHELHPFAYMDAPRSPWSRGQWKVYLRSNDEIEAAIEYVENNPLKEGRPLQKWPFVTRFKGLPSGAVHYFD